MKRFKKLMIFTAVILVFASCSRVPAGHVGIKFHLLGNSKGVDYEELSPGLYWIGAYKELYRFPTFSQNYVWTVDPTEGSKNNEQFVFQDKEGLELSADIGITYRLDPTKVPMLFERYKRGIDEITDVFLRNMVRDALVSNTSSMDVDMIYGEGRTELLKRVEDEVQEQVEELGIIIERLYWIGSIRVPDGVRNAIDMKIRATQTAIQRENELREAEAEARKRIAEAEGRAESRLREAIAEAEANRIVNASLTNQLIEYRKIDKWDGKVPQVQGAGTPIIDMRSR